MELTQKQIKEELQEIKDNPTFTVGDIISFGKYLLSDERKNKTLPCFRKDLNYSDFDDWDKYKRKVFKERLL